MRLLRTRQHRHTTLEEFENAALFLQLGHTNPSQKQSFENAVQARGIRKMPAFNFHDGGNHFENRAFQKLCSNDDNVISLTKFSSAQIQND